MQYAEKNGTHLLKDGAKIRGYVQETKTEGWAYFIGKPSDTSVSRFTGNQPLTLEQAKERLMNAAR